MTARRGLTLIVFLAAVVYWGMLLLQAEGSVFSRAPLLDELYYLDRAADDPAPWARDGGVVETFGPEASATVSNRQACVDRDMYRDGVHGDGGEIWSPEPRVVPHRRCVRRKLCR